MLSVVEHRNDPRVLIVRARLKGDLVAFFGRNVTIDETPDADYRWRTYVSRPRLKIAISREVDKIEYDNFKNSVKNDARHDAYMKVWSAMLSAQNAEMPKKLSSIYHRPPFLTSLFAASSDSLPPRPNEIADELPFTKDDAEQEVGDVLESYGFRLSRPIREFIVEHADA
jgi:hypothetical protein